MADIFNAKLRIGRAYYLFVNLLCFGLVVLSFLVFAPVISILPSNTNDELIGYIMSPIVIPVIILTVCVSFIATLNRIRDIGWSLGFCVLFFIPVINKIFNLILLFTRGKDYKICASCRAKVEQNTAYCSKCGKNAFIKASRKEEKLGDLPIITAFVYLCLVLSAIMGNFLSTYKIPAPQPKVQQEQALSQQLTSNVQSEMNLLSVYNNAVSYCNDFEFEGAGGYYECLDNNIHSQLQLNYKMLKAYEEIKNNCRGAKSNEADYRNCIEKIITKQSNK